MLPKWITMVLTAHAISACTAAARVQRQPKKTSLAATAHVHLHSGVAAQAHLLPWQTRKDQTVLASPVSLDAVAELRLKKSMQPVTTVLANQPLMVAAQSSWLEAMPRSQRSTAWDPTALLLHYRRQLQSSRHRRHHRQRRSAPFATEATRTDRRRSRFCTLLAKVSIPTTKATRRMVLSRVLSQHLLQSP